MKVKQFNSATELPIFSGMQGFKQVYAAVDTEDIAPGFDYMSYLTDIDMDAWLLVLPMKEAEKVFKQAVKSGKDKVKESIEEERNFTGVGVALFELPDGEALLLSADGSCDFDSLLPEEYYQKQDACCHFSPDKLQLEHPDLYEKIKHFFDPKWM